MPRRHLDPNTEVVDAILQNAAVKLWHDMSETGYATIAGRETWPIKSFRFEKFIREQHMEVIGEIAPKNVVSCIQDELEARALDGPQHDPQIRVNEHGGNLYLNVGDWRVIEIGPDSWAVRNHAIFPVIRQPHSLSYPEPVRGGKIEELRPFINSDDKQFKLIVAFILASLRKSMEYPILFLHGAPDVGKTTMTNLIASLIDPSSLKGTDIPETKKDLGVYALHHHLVSFDNLSKIKHEVSDALCRLGTGYSDSSRTLYTNHGESAFNIYRPVVFNGIVDVVWRDDLARRSMVVTLDSPVHKIPPDIFEAQFQEKSSVIFGAILDALSCSLRNYRAKVEEYKVEKVHGLKSVVAWVEAAAPSLGWKPGEFLEIYNEIQITTSQLLMEADVLAKVVTKFMEDREEYHGTYDKFMVDCVLCRDIGRQGRWAFENSKTFFSALDRLKNGLEKNGIGFRRQGVVDGKQQFSLRKI